MHIISGSSKFDLLDAVVERVIAYREKWPYHRAFILVPENRKVMVEEALLRAQAQRQQLVLAEVLSLPRLAQRLFGLLGNYHKIPASDNLVNLLLYKHVNTAADQSLYANLSQFYKRPEYTRKLLRTHREFQRSSAGIGTLSAALEQGGALTARLIKKLAAMADLGRAYRENMERYALADNSVLLTDLQALLAAYHKNKADVASPYGNLAFLDDTYIWFYGYGEDTLITQQEWQLILWLERICTQVELTLKLPYGLDTARLEAQGLNYVLDLYGALSHNGKWIWQAGISAAVELFNLKSDLKGLTFTTLHPQATFNYTLHKLITKEQLRGFEGDAPQAVTAGVCTDDARGTASDCTPKNSVARSRASSGGTTEASVACTTEASSAGTKSNLQERVALYKAKTLKSALEAIITDIKNRCLDASGSVDWQDCAIALADYENDGEQLLTLLEKYNIPCFIAEPERATGSVLTRYLQALLKILQSGLDRKQVLNFLRLPCMALPADDVDEYENYLLALDLNYEQLVDERSFYKIQDLNYAEAQLLAKRYAETYLLPLQALRERLRREPGRKERIAALLQFFKDTDLEEQITKLSADLSVGTSLRERLAGLRLRKHWQQLHSDLRELIIYSADLQTESLTDFLNFLQLSVGDFVVEKLPMASKQVMVGSLAAVAQARHKYLYIVNLTQANLLTPSADGEHIFSKQDVELLEKFASHADTASDFAGAFRFNRFFGLKLDACAKTVLYSRLYDLTVLTSERVSFYHCADRAALEEAPTFLLQLQRYVAWRELKNETAGDLVAAKDLLQFARSKLLSFLELGKVDGTLAAALQAEATFWQRAYVLWRQRCRLQAEKVDGVSELHGTSGVGSQVSLLSSLQVNNAYQSYLLDLLELADKLKGKLAALDSAASQVAATFDVAPVLFQKEASSLFICRDSALLKRLLPEKLLFSLSQLELYRANPFAYFARYLLGVKERRTTGSDRRNYGIILHSFAELLMKTCLHYCSDNKLVAQDSTALSELLPGLLNSLEQATTMTDNYRRTFNLYRSDSEFLLNFNRTYQALLAALLPDYHVMAALAQLKGTADYSHLRTQADLKRHLTSKVLATAQVLNSQALNIYDWQFRNFIYPQLLQQADENMGAVLLGLNAGTAYGKDVQAAYLPLALEQGVQLSREAYNLQGKIDRIDFVNNKAEIALIDYKSGNKKFDYARLLAGLDLQLPLYSQFFSAEGLPVATAAYLKLGSNLQAGREQLSEHLSRKLGKQEFATSASVAGAVAVDGTLAVGGALGETEVYTRPKTLFNFDLVNKDAEANERYWKNLSSYALALSDHSVGEILAGKFPYEPLVDKSLESSFLPYQAIAKYALEQSNYRFLKRESDDDAEAMSASKQDKQDLLKALDRWSAALQSNAVTSDTSVAAGSEVAFDSDVATTVVPGDKTADTNERGAHRSSDAADAAAYNEELQNE